MTLKNAAKSKQQWITLRSADGRLLGRVRKLTSFTWEARRWFRSVQIEHRYLASSRKLAEDWLRSFERSAS